ncbi:hypothetical protein [Alteromonas macleodii]|uniref:Uncharacterized protein n=1 Tax=Alteromonas macleodii TaxID=28108 RepID=A0AB36FRG2_ALTMA|nr:hypothetical protein [Alteromonas macleodii]OES24180.1 hypothetical protein BFV93_4780 [Alteromonas macleodii]OES24814.1 hypothetical protein BFV95_4573 [Alteromonas macleodii]OES25092.1 hypothetical protein BFV94_4563 [Alteromonas macleodii]OES39135.1 hypothetical protein BFV96_4283 [Alteromonas macleodii]
MSPFFLLKYLAAGVLLLLLLMVTSTEYFSHLHQKNIRELYDFAGQTYLEEEPYPIEVVHQTFFHSYLASRFEVTGPKLSYLVLSKENFKNAGLGDSCEALEYLSMFDSETDASVYDASPFCCIPNVTDSMLPIVYDQKEDRVLAMCGLSADVHVVGIGATQFTQLMERNYPTEDGSPFFEIRDMHKID